MTSGLPRGARSPLTCGRRSGELPYDANGAPSAPSGAAAHDRRAAAGDSSAIAIAHRGAPHMRDLVRKRKPRLGFCPLVSPSQTRTQNLFDPPGCQIQGRGSIRVAVCCSLGCRHAENFLAEAHLECLVSRALHRHKAHPHGRQVN